MNNLEQKIKEEAKICSFDKSYISVIVPVYNVENYLAKCLDSLINQTMQDIEIICVDDCSTDGSLDILQEYALKDSRIKVIKQEKNQGEVVAKRAGALQASANYIGTLDPDDYLPENYYEVLYTEIIENNADIAVANIYRIKENGILIKNKKCNMINQEECFLWDSKSATKINTGTPNKIIKKEIYLYAMDFNQRNIWKDYYQYWRSFTKFTPKVIKTSKTSYFYRKRSGSITRGKNFKKEKLQQLLNTIDLILKHLIENNLYNEYKKEFWKDAHVKIKKSTKTHFRYFASIKEIEKIIKNYQISKEDISVFKELSFKNLFMID